MDVIDKSCTKVKPQSFLRIQCEPSTGKFPRNRSDRSRARARGNTEKKRGGCSWHCGRFIIPNLPFCRYTCRLAHSLPAYSCSLHSWLSPKLLGSPTCLVGREKTASECILVILTSPEVRSTSTGTSVISNDASPRFLALCKDEELAELE